MTTRHRTALYAGLAIAVMLAMTVDVLADETKTFTWSPPTQRVDGSAIVSGELTEYELQCDGGQVFLRAFAAADAPDDSFAVDMPIGQWTCTLRVANAGGFSDWSAPVFFQVLPAVPNAPADFSVD